jgi:cbb3-type cytochrome oxidase cytochrome c subunit
MRASDETFYNIKRLHRLFAVSAAAMLAATVWMVAADHWRPWKVYQRTFRDQIEPWVTEAATRQQETDEFTAREEELNKALDEARRAVPKERVAELERSLEAARFRRDHADRRLRFRRAEFDEARSNYESAVGQGLPQAKLDALERKAGRIRDDVARLAAEAEEAATQCDALSRSLAEITRPEDQARQALADHLAVRDRLQRALDQQTPGVGKQLLRLPLVDAFGRPSAIDQIWLPELTIDYNFRQVARFDRCTTCHQGIDKTAPDSAADPAYLSEEVLRLALVSPKEPPQPATDADATREDPIRRAYGFSPAPRGILDPQAVTVGVVLPQTPAAKAGLLAGDVIAAVNGRPIATRADLQRVLLDDVSCGKPLEVEVRRGLPHPYRSHPRLDLFAGPKSPHPLAEFGCTICHDGQGAATDFTYASHAPNDPDQRARWRRRHGWVWNHDWDFAMRPARFAQSNCLKCHHDVSDLAPSRRFPDPPAAKLVEGYQLIRQSGCFGCHEIRGVTGSGQRVGPDLRPEPAGGKPPTDAGSGPGTLPKVGPSLRSIADKLDAAFLQSWIARPADFRPEPRMPQFFRMHAHLDGRGFDEARRFEPVEIAAVTAYLRAVSQPVAALGPPEKGDRHHLCEAPSGPFRQMVPVPFFPPSAERGKRLFQTQGCLACHKHAEFPAAPSTQGPDLSRIGAKLPTPAGKTWLVSWLRDPGRHSPRTLMPNPLLEPAAAGLEGAKPQAADGAADIAAYLAESGGWEPKPVAAPLEADLDQLALLYLGKTLPKSLAEMSLAEKLRDVGRRTIRKRGCFGCHDVPGFEDAQPIGPPLSDWGRKQESQLAFEQVHQLVLGSGGDAPADADQGFYLEALLSKRREGFAWQKLRDPRSFDYKKTANKSYDEHLLMGRFSLSEAQREAIITFVLGLVAEPPKEKYVYRPDRRTQAIVEGRKALDKYGCAQCHTLEMERWTIDVDPKGFPPPPAAAEYPFLKPQLAPRQVKASQQLDRRGVVRLELTGMPQWNAEGKPDQTEDEEGNPQVAMVLWEPAAIAGQVWPVGGAGVLLSAGQIVRKRPALGGDYARLLYPVALADAKAAGSTATVVEAWGWVPPALVHEGNKVQPAWLYNYLLSPTVIRPAAVLRMPKYQLSPEEAGKLVDYFAAVAGVEFPYTTDPRSAIQARLTGGTADPQRQERALRLVIDRTMYCAKCHLIGDFSPGGENRTILAPNLERVGSRLRPEYLRRWLANPKSVLPYTAMPVNFPPDQAMGQELLPGTSLEQLDAVMGLLLDYDQSMKRRTSIRHLIDAGALPKAESGMP